jgi:hypothetical protein
MPGVFGSGRRKEEIQVTFHGAWIKLIMNAFPQRQKEKPLLI